MQTNRKFRIKDHERSYLEKRFNRVITTLRPRLSPEEHKALKEYRDKFGYDPQEPKGGDKPARVFVFDIETSPTLAHVWGRWKQNVRQQQVVDEWFIICWAGEWLDTGEVVSDCLTPEEARMQDDSRVIHGLWEMFDEADILVAHNGNRFDIKKANARFLLNDMLPPSPYRQVDTLLEARRHFSFGDNSLNNLAKIFGYEMKHDTNFQLWSDSIRGDQDALDEMLAYCENDVSVLVNVYLKLRPYIKNHPNVALYEKDNKFLCSKCGSCNTTDDGKFYYTNVNKYRVLRCTDCGGMSRFRHTELKEQNKKHLVTSI